MERQSATFTSVTIYNAIREAFPEAELVDAGKVMVELRSVKSENELACLRTIFLLLTDPIQTKGLVQYISL